MTDIDVLLREIQCVERKSKINCTNCGSCDLLMDDAQILSTYSNAIAALQEKQWREQLWHDAKTDPPKTPGLYYGAKDDTNSMWAVRYRDGEWTLDISRMKIDVVKWANFADFVSDEDGMGCCDIEFGTYKCYVKVPGYNIYCDKCLATEVRILNDMGIKTVGCCCGHRKAHGYIQVASEYVERMKELGYQQLPEAYNGYGKWCFVPKSILLWRGNDKATHGCWIVTREGNYLKNTCSVCGLVLKSDDSCIADTYDYCPKCGAEMDMMR